MKCGKCGKEMEIEGANRWYPPKEDAQGRKICPWCAHPNGEQKYGFALYTGPVNARTVANNPFAPPDWVKLVDDLNKAMKNPGKLVPAYGDPGAAQALPADPGEHDHDVHMKASEAFFMRMPYLDDIIFGDEPFVPDMSDPLGGAYDELDDDLCDDADDDSEEFDCPCFYDDDEEAYQ